MCFLTAGSRTAAEIERPDPEDHLEALPLWTVETTCSAETKQRRSDHRATTCKYTAVHCNSGTIGEVWH